MANLDELLNPRNQSYLDAHNLNPVDPDEEALEIDEEDLPNSKVKLRAFGDFKTLRNDIHSKVLSAIGTSYPKENDRYRLQLKDIVHENKDYTLNEQKKAIQSGKSLTTKIKGTWSLIDKATDASVDEVKATLANVPYLTNRGTFVRNGAETVIVNQMRLKPGIYTRKKSSGEMEAHVNVKPGTGHGFKLILDPESGVFKVKAGQANWKLYPLLNAMGVTDEELSESWGPDILKVNKDATDTRIVQKAYDKLVTAKDKKLIGENPTFEQLGPALRASFERAELDPYVTNTTLGIRARNMNMDAFKRASQKVLNLSKGLDTVDSRDSLAYQKFMSPDDLLAERISKDSGKLGGNMLWQSTHKGNLSRIKPGALNSHFESLFNGSGLAQNIEEINPMEMMDQGERVVILGEGGIGDISMIPDDAREVQPSHFMFIDPVRSPESLKIGVDSRFARNTKRGDDGNLYTKVMNAKTGRGTYITPQIAAKSVIAFPGEMAKGKPMVRAMVNGKTMTTVDRDEVNYEGQHMQDMFSSSSNLTPMASSIKAGRLLMSGKFVSQALPLRNAEAPLVRSSMGNLDDQSMEDAIGEKLGAIKAKQGGQVVKASREGMTVKYDDGTTEDIELYDNFSFNRKTYINSKPMLKAGKTFAPGDLLASSNFTDDKGTMALGKNLRVAYLSYKGLNYDDGQVISESAAKKLSSEHMYEHAADKISGVSFDKNRFTGLFPKKYTTEQIGNIDENGIIKEGTTVVPGDPLILSTTATRAVNSLLRDNRKSYNSDSSVTWDHHDTGVVTDVYNTRSGVNVVVKAYAAAQVGDKLSGRHADKGVIACYDDQTEILTKRGWVLFKDLLETDLVASLNDGIGQFVLPKERMEYIHEGDMYGCQTDALDYLVTGNHRMYCRIGHYRGKKALFKIREASNMHGRIVSHKTAAKFKLKSIKEDITIPLVTGNKGKPSIHVFDRATFYSFMGWYLSEGSLSYYAPNSVGVTKTKVTNYKIQIAQSSEVHPENCLEIERVLTKMGVAWHYHGCQYSFSNRSLHEYLKPLGLSHEKYIPKNLIWSGDATTLSSFMDAYLAGDGSAAAESHQGWHGYMGATSVSERLLNDVSVVASLLGVPTVLKQVIEASNEGRWRAQYSLRFRNHTESGNGSQYKPNYYIQQYFGRVYCVSVPGEGLVLVRRNGKPLWCGNSIVDDDKMPHDKNGVPYDILASPLGITSRVNPAQLTEAWLGKVARKTGKIYSMPASMTDSYIKYAQKELSDAGLERTDDIIDPMTGKTIPSIQTGERFYMKLHHTAEAKQSARGIGAYTSEGQPAKGGKSGGKRFCFAPRQKIKTLNGEVKISAIVEKKLAAFVWSYDWKKEIFCYMPVTDWHTRRAAITDLIQIDLSGIPSDSDTFNHLHRSMYVTKEHALYKVDGSKVVAGKVKVGDKLATWGPLLGDVHRSVLLGSMLGDGGLLFSASTSAPVYQEEHSGKQKNYIKWKAELLSGFGAYLRESKKTYKDAPYISQVYSISYPHVTRELEELCISSTEGKQVTKEWIDKLDDLAVSIWILDDGSIRNKAKKKGQVHLAGNIATHGFKASGVKLLSDWLTNRYEKTRPTAGGRIDLSAACCRVLADVVANNVPWAAIPPSKSWLRRYCKRMQIKGFTAPSSKVELACVPCWVLGVKPYTHDKPDVTEINVYDLTVDGTHVYTASGVFVSNSSMEIGALISHGATEILRDAKLVRGQRNDEFWQDFKLGKNPAPKGVPFVYDKFLNSLQAAGIKVDKTNDSVNIFAMTNKDVDSMAQHEIRTSDTLDQKDRKPIPGGLFDITSTGGVDGNRWSYIKLDDPLPNPVMEDPLRSILKMTKKEYYDVLSGATKVRNKTGGAAIEELLKGIQLDKELSQARAAIATAPVSTKDKFVKRYKHLKAMKANGVHPMDFMLSKIPVLPPAFRPVSVLPDGTNLVADVNYLYGDLLESRNDLRDLKKSLGDEDLTEERLKIYNAYKAVTGVGEPVGTESIDSGVKGILKGVFGSSPKLGSFQRRVVGMTLDTVGRGVITPNPKFNMDEVGLPINQAWDLYKPFIIRELVKHGTPATMATKSVDNKELMALNAMQRVMKERPVLINRAPTLHKFGLMAAWPTLVDGDSLQVSPSTTLGYGADFDGDHQVNSVYLSIPLDYLNSTATVHVKGTPVGDLTLTGRRADMSFTQLQIPTVSDGYSVVIVDLEDFPHGAVRALKKGKNGKIAFFDAAPDTEVLVYDKDTAALKWAPVDGWSEHYDREVEIVTLSSGYQIITDDDERGVYGMAVDTFEEHRCRPSEAVGKMMVPRMTSIPTVPAVATYITVDDWITKRAGNNNLNQHWQLPETLTLTQELGYLIGVFIGDGWASGHRDKEGDIRRSQIHVCGLDKDVQDEFDHCLQFLLEGIAPTVHTRVGDNTSAGGRGTVTRSTYSSVELSRLLEALCGHGAHKKHLPPFYLATPEDFRIGLLGGLMDTDGSVSVSNGKSKPQLMAGYTSVNLRLCREVRLLLASLNIRSRITSFKYKGQEEKAERNKQAWQVGISTIDAVKWQGKGMRCKRKLDKLVGVTADENSGAAARYDLVPFPLPLKTEIKKLIPTPKHAKDELTDGYYTAIKNGYCSRIFARRVLERVSAELRATNPLWDRWVAIVNNSGVTWDHVTSFEQTGIRETGYDLTVPGYETFMSVDGVILSNTMQYHVPVRESAVKEAVEKMMPSKNLLDIADFKPHILPRMEFLQGLYLASTAEGKGPEKVFKDMASVLKAYKQGKIRLSDNIKIAGQAPAQRPTLASQVLRG